MTMRLSRVPAAWCHGALLLFLALCAPAVARTHAVAPGEVPVLEPNEGLLLLAVDTNTRLLSADVSPQGSTVAIAKFGRAAPGYNARLFVVPAGTYYWARFNTTFNLRVTLDMLDLLSYPRQIRSIVVNRSDSKVGLSLEQVEQVVRCPISARVPSSRAVPISINKGTPITLDSPAHPVSHAIARFAQQRILPAAEATGVAPEPASRRGRRSA